MSLQTRELLACALHTPEQIDGRSLTMWLHRAVRRCTTDAASTSGYKAGYRDLDS
jgi:hypothetical protein